GWLDPNAAEAPRTQTELKDLLRRLEMQPEVRYAHPFVLSPEGAHFGIQDDFYVKLKSPNQYAQLQQLASQTGTTIIGPDRYLPQVYHLRADKNAAADPLRLTLWLRSVADFAYVDVNYLVNPIVATNDPFYIHQWSLENTGIAIQGNGTPGADMSVPEAWNITTGASNIKIAIVDSGTDTAHPDLRDNLLPGYDGNGNGSEGYPNTTYAEDAHGTNCAGIVAAKGDNNIGVAGVCYDCSIIPVKVFYYINNPFGGTFPFSDGNAMADGINWAVQTGDADVLSNSWGVPDILHAALPGGTSIVEDAIQTALSSGRDGKGCLLFFSSGNDGGAPLWPGRLAGCISVNATSMCDERKTPMSCDGANWEGNFGDSLDIGAPGVQVATTDMTGSMGYDPSDYNLSFGGTSAACPNAAGVMGLILS
ncbi:MAG: S8 family serine peptidase, partial [Bacteroidota bacterium]